MDSSLNNINVLSKQMSCINNFQIKNTLFRHLWSVYWPVFMNILIHPHPLASWTYLNYRILVFWYISKRYRILQLQMTCKIKTWIIINTVPHKILISIIADNKENKLASETWRIHHQYPCCKGDEGTSSKRRETVRPSSTPTLGLLWLCPMSSLLTTL
jgi:hypothetical protein